MKDNEIRIEPIEEIPKIKRVEKREIQEINRRLYRKWLQVCKSSFKEKIYFQ